MGKTAALRKLIKSQLDLAPGETYHKRIPSTENYPYKVFTLRNISFVDARDDIYLDIDIWNNAKDQTVAEDIADQIEHQLSGANLPQSTIYPTFFRDFRRNVEDPDKTLQHIQLGFLIQLYEQGGITHA